MTANSSDHKKSMTASSSPGAWVIFDTRFHDNMQWIWIGRAIPNKNFGMINALGQMIMDVGTFDDVVTGCNEVAVNIL